MRRYKEPVNVGVVGIGVSPGNSRADFGDRIVLYRPSAPATGDVSANFCW
jgi:hypothetical protein